MNFLSLSKNIHSWYLELFPPIGGEGGEGGGGLEEKREGGKEKRRKMQRMRK